MLKQLFTLCLLIILGVTPLAAQLQSPDDFLPHKLGEQFTPHEWLVNYVQHVATNSPQVMLTEYGRTNEQRPLLMAFISTPENLARLEQIRTNNLRRAGVLEGATDPALDDLTIVWLSFGVHGNEAAGPESSMRVLYELGNPTNARTQAWLKNTLVIFDPSINPDGYSRYTHWYRGVSNTTPDVRREAREHQEPWPGGRTNHYYFDLNRDWAWQTQVESQQRLARYNQWLPQIHVDFHEQGYASPYYFAPAAQPYHQYITQWQRDFQFQLGKNHAKYFDQNGWLYFTREVFDLLYPSYGDTYPTYNGAIGMTYEQGGIGAGRAIQLPNGDTLTLYDRVAHHTTTALSTVEMASKNARELNQQFASFFNRARTNPAGPYKSFIIKGTNSPERLKRLTTLLDRNAIQYGRAGKTSGVNAYDYQTGKTITLKVEANDLVVSAYQPHGTLAQILLEPEAVLVDSMTYDITAWSLPYAYGLEAYASSQRLDPQAGGYTFSPPATVAGAPYAYLINWESLTQARFLASLVQAGIRVRYATEPVTIEGKAFGRGTLVITRADNRKMGTRFDETLKALAQKQQISLHSVNTGFADSGHDFGARAYQLVPEVNIALLGGEQTNGNEFGQTWYYFEQDLGMPVAVLDADRIDRFDLNAYNVLVMPEGRFRLTEGQWEKISTWVNGGGRLIAVGDALGALTDRKGFGLTRYADDQAKKAAQAAADKAALEERFLDYAGQDRRELSNFTPGAILQVKLDNTHPLAFGQGSQYFSLKTTNVVFQPLKNAWNVGVVVEKPIVSGFVGHQAMPDLEGSLVFAVERKGAGSVVYMVDNPLFRAFWDNGKFLFSNAVFFR
ncbi:MAG: zinc carboxypeptidase [Lewinellaceae bacterium]|nr:zinc carboxypeptidase [Lewinellaceae bacterium]